MTYVQVPIRFGRESCVNPATGNGQVFVAKFGFDLRVLARFVERAKEAFLEYYPPRFGPLRSIGELYYGAVRRLVGSRYVGLLRFLKRSSWHSTSYDQRYLPLLWVS